MLARVLEPEVMDSFAEVRDYDAMDHGEVNRRFVADLLEFLAGQERSPASAPSNESANEPAAPASESTEPAPPEFLDVGTGTAQIPIELCRQRADVRVWAIDLASHMLDLGRANVEVAGLADRIRLDRVDAKALPYDDGRFAGVISNSIVHHIPEPRGVLAEMARVVRPGGVLFVRDLMRPGDEALREWLVETYAAGATDHQRQMFADSLHAALTLHEVRALIAELGFDPRDVERTSDRHWTWRWVRGA